MKIATELIAHVQCLGTEAVVPGVVLATSQIDMTEFFCGIATKQVVFESLGSIASAKEKPETVLEDLWLSAEASSHADTGVDLETMFLFVGCWQELKGASPFGFATVPTRVGIDSGFIAEQTLGFDHN